MHTITPNKRSYNFLHKKNKNDYGIKDNQRKKIRTSLPLKEDDSTGTFSEKTSYTPRTLQVTCALCDCSFEDINTLYEHMKSIHDTCHYCELCDEEFTTSKALLCHMNKKHNKRGSTVIPNNNNFLNVNEYIPENGLPEVENTFLEDELQEIDETSPDALDSQQMLCLTRSLTKTNAEGLNNIMDTHSSMSQSYYMCEICKQIFMDISQLSEHTVNEHSSADVTLDSYIQVLQSSESVGQDIPPQYEHIQLDDENREYIDVEPVIYSFMAEDSTDNSAITLKEDEHHTMYHCSYCKALFDKAVDYFDHKKLHDSSLVLKCVACKQEFQTEFSFIQHKKFYPSHFSGSNGKPFECDLCSQRFKHIGNLTKHRARHKPYSMWEYKCHMCGDERKFETNRLLLHHLKTIHPPQNITPKNVEEICRGDKQISKNSAFNKLPCMHCGELFTKMCDFVLHQNCHNLWNIFKCVSCNQEFYSEESYKKHKKYHDPEFVPTNTSSFECDLCPRKYSRFGSLCQHRLCHKRRTVGQRVCEKCNIQYESPTELFYHIVRCHKEMFLEIKQRRKKK